MAKRLSDFTFKTVRDEKNIHQTVWKAAGWKHEGVKVFLVKYLELISWQASYVALNDL